ncbi:hypothetical protein ACFYZ9_39640 [Streptomyces sp. NPDC001691]|uniref:hypothetical protein n=1 Tax=Streptomyces sp. NPDC001691 TaxID=3364600 RepID=UPI0036867D64
MAISRVRKMLLTGLVSAFAVTATALGAAHAVTGSPSPAAAAASDEMPSTTEDFNYPDAAKIQAEKGITLKRGDGHIVLSSCDGTEDIKVLSKTGQKDYCFAVKAKAGYVTLELARAYGIWTKAAPVKTTIKDPDGDTTVINAPANAFTGYGEATAERIPTSLIELRVTG